ncbi:hypothetical protein DTO164E3_8813 [Paecilomyces variotii]|nr:hypothetical protein DTO164E3_8813 [Paecilomyces variotii]KAJ9243700.1 hypothetical protein DTO169E5_2615 [Paecilomyces variotii]KAJ9246406.1 hypothetical protein DTO207G8_8976 [Paecilomyces variotii]KAJ9383499.1 hypothetical protein DTO063F5_5156 [Paecilomyces variotii]
MLQLNLPLILLLYTSLSQGTIVRRPIITRFNPTRRTVSSNYTTPIQIGNGNFAFGADITGLQTLQPFNTLSSWGWHNTSLPNNTTPANFTGLDWWTHGRLVNYDQPNPAEPEISQWLIANPHRVNLGRVGFAFFEGDVAVNVLMERDVSSAMQELDLYSGSVKSVFTVNGSEVEVTTVVDPQTDTLAVKTSSTLLNEGRLGFFVDYPYATDVNKFEAPTTNPTFELAYWRFGLDTAITWKQRLNEPVPETWSTVAAHLAPLPTTKSPTGEETYTLYEGISNMWRDPQTVMDHPALTAIYGLLPAPSRAPDILNRTILTATAVEVARAWNFTDCWGWDFPMLAMNSVRLGDVDAAVRYLVDEYFQFDDVGMPIGSEGKAPTPYFPGSGGLLQAVAMMAGGWGGEDTGFVPAFPRDWMARVEKFKGVL